MTVPGIPTEVLIAPDKFKGTFTATAVADALQSGLAASGQPASVCPVADGGDGTLDALAGPLALELHNACVSDPLGRPVQARFGLGARGVAIVEVAAASGLALLGSGRRDPVGATTRGTGELIVAAIEAGATAVHVAVGGSATTDGGAGAIEVISGFGGLRGARLTLLCDVRTPFEQAARVFAAQKGADAEQIEELSARLDCQAGSLAKDPRGVPMTGAAGGLSGGLWAQFDAELVPGAMFVLGAIGFDARMRAARAVITGEGRLDRQSLVGKVVSEVATRARQAGVPCHAVVGVNQLERFDARILDLQLILEATTLAELERAGAELGATIRDQHG